MGVLLVSSAKIKAFTQVNDNVDDALLLSSIQISQDIGLQTLLGTRFYNHLLDAVQASTLTTAENTLLQDYIQPYLLWRSVWEALPTLYMRIMNKSVIIGNTEQGSAVDKGSFTYLRNIHQNRYEFYAQRMMDYIKNNPGDYPLYWQYTSTDGMKPSRENYFGGIHISNAQPRKLPPVGWNNGVAGLPAYLDPSSDWCCFDNSY